MNITGYKSVLKLIKPSSKESKDYQKICDYFLKTLDENLNKIFARAILGGSSAKDTWLKNNDEADIFIQFSYKKHKDKSQEISDLLEKELKKSFPKKKLTRLHGSRDYFHLKIDKVTFEVIPIIKIESADQALNITDISPLHAKWVNSKAKNLKDDIRLAKQFAKASKVYGAESYLSSFSGYALEILTTYYGGFEHLIKAAAKWNSQVIIDPEKHYPKNMVTFELNNSKLLSPIVIVDPVDKTRNVAAALSKEKFLLFQKKAKEFLKNPSTDFFEIKTIKLTNLKRTAKEKKINLVYFEIKVQEGKKDVVGAKLLKVFKHLKKSLKKFNISSCDWEWQPGRIAKFYFLLKSNTLPEYEIRIGPPKEFKDHVKDFKKKNKTTFEKGGKLHAKIKLSPRDLDKFSKKLVREKYILEKIDSVKKIEIF